MSRRPRHMWMRFAYLGILLAVVLVALLGSGGGSENSSLATLAKGASQTFKLASITQLLLMSFLSPVFTAGAITQERDAQTFNILISTPLSNAQIVIGSLASRLFFVIVLLMAGLPIFLTTMIYGGVTTGQIMRSFAISGGTAVAHRIVGYHDQHDSGRYASHHLLVFPGDWSVPGDCVGVGGGTGMRPG